MAVEKKSKNDSRERNEKLGDRLQDDTPLTLQDLLEIMNALRTPVTGCPWDIEQDFKTIAPYTIEEAYEVADAIETENLDELKDELGDLLFQVVYHAQMAKEENRFDFANVVDAISRKMLRRHPHVFGDETVRAATDVKGLWDRVKAQEKAADANAKPEGLLDSVPLALPGLTRAVKLQSKAAKVGFDWPSIEPVIDKLREELGELKEAIDNTSSNNVHIEEEFGDVLFVLANMARHLNIDPEQALRGANQKMVRRFSYIESQLANSGRTPEDSDLEEMDRLWDEAKANEKSTS